LPGPELIGAHDQIFKADQNFSGKSIAQGKLKRLFSRSITELADLKIADDEQSANLKISDDEQSADQPKILAMINPVI
jgi:hypothetical protein